MRITITHKPGSAQIASKTGPLKRFPIHIEAEEGNDVIKKALDIVRGRFLKPNKSLTIHIEAQAENI